MLLSKHLFYLHLLYYEITLQKIRKFADSSHHKHELFLTQGPLIGKQFFGTLVTSLESTELQTHTHYIEYT